MKVKIIDIAYGGYGIAKNDEGKIIFVPHSINDDILDVSMIKEKKNFAYASINKILEPSNYRIEPKCKYSGICGGCAFNHIDYNKQLEIKKNIVLNAIRNIEYNKNIKIIFDDSKGYRLRVNMIAENGKIGFYKFNTNEFISINECYILKQSLFDRIKNFAEENNITGKIYSIENNIKNNDDNEKNNQALAFIHINKNIKNINIKNFNKYFNGISIKYNKKIKSYGDENILYKTKYANIVLGHKTFFQSNLYLLDQFQKYAVKYLDENDKNIIELYEGSGFFTAAIESTLKKFNNNYNFISSEINKESVIIANKYGFNIINEDSAKTLKNAKHNIDVIFADPPREGLDKNVINNIIRIKPKKIIYISCNPMTFARDINLLKDHYNLIDLNIIDMFADTYHIELISYLNLI